MEGVYDPLSYENLARSIVTALMEKESEPLPPCDSFPGAGVYAIYYTGTWPAYQALRSTHPQRPIYVGKAIPPGGRKGKLQDTSGGNAPTCKRLNEHAKSIDQAENLSIADFSCRYLVVVPVWITLAEQFLISHFHPIWNTVVDGFGNHAPGRGRKDMRRPRWDILHPGRPWARKLDAAETADQILSLLSTID